VLRAKGASQGELRIQGFLLQAVGEDSWNAWPPIVPGRGRLSSLFETSAAILFLHNVSSGHLSEIASGFAPAAASDDPCRASCVIGIGNARPLFVRGRIIALLGYELVEGARQGDTSPRSVA